MLELVPFTSATETTIGNWIFKCEPIAEGFGFSLKTTIILSNLTAII